MVAVAIIAAVVIAAAIALVAAIWYFRKREEAKEEAVITPAVVKTAVDTPTDTAVSTTAEVQGAGSIDSLVGISADPNFAPPITAASTVESIPPFRCKCALEAGCGNGAPAGALMDEVTGIADASALEQYGACATGSSRTGWVCFDANDEVVC
ncbi:MAG: hypothetical protein WC483_03590 [Candidatus Paceibacterota bacterium]